MEKKGKKKQVSGDESALGLEELSVNGGRGDGEEVMKRQRFKAVERPVSDCLHTHHLPGCWGTLVG
jgi:hypothetical protein